MGPWNKERKHAVLVCPHTMSRSTLRGTFAKGIIPHSQISCHENTVPAWADFENPNPTRSKTSFACSAPQTIVQVPQKVKRRLDKGKEGLLPRTPWQSKRKGARGRDVHLYYTLLISDQLHFSFTLSSKFPFALYFCQVMLPRLMSTDQRKNCLAEFRVP